MLFQESKNKMRNILFVLIGLFESQAVNPVLRIGQRCQFAGAGVGVRIKLAFKWS